MIDFIELAKECGIAHMPISNCVQGTSAQLTAFANAIIDQCAERCFVDTMNGREIANYIRELKGQV